jgi:hypothetical protein
MGTAHLLADDRNGVSGEVALNCELTALLKVGGRDFTWGALISTSGVTICSRCHGTLSLPWQTISSVQASRRRGTRLLDALL